MKVHVPAWKSSIHKEEIHIFALYSFVCPGWLHYAKDLGKVSILWLQEWKELYRHYAIIVKTELESLG